MGWVELKLSGVEYRNIPWLSSLLVGQVLLTVEASLFHSDTPHCVGILWTSDQSDAENFT